MREVGFAALSCQPAHTPLSSLDCPTAQFIPANLK